MLAEPVNPIASRFSPPDIECLVQAAVELMERAADPGGLSAHQQDTLDRARRAVHAVRAGQAPELPQAVALIGPCAADRAWVLRRWDRHQDEVSLHADQATGLAELAGYVRGSWEDLGGQGGIPDQPPADDAQAVHLYYGPGGEDRPDQGYDLHEQDITRPVRTRIVPLDHRFPDAGASDLANRAAVFHPQTGEDTLPCMEVGGVLVFTYLDHRSGAVRVSVHLDGTDEHLVRPDGTVPLRVKVEDEVVLDDSAEGAPRPQVLARLLAAASEDQQAVIRKAALTAGVLWHCPNCQWDNPDQATCCEGPGPCRTPKQAAAPKKCGWGCGDDSPGHRHFAVLVREPGGKLLGRLTPDGHGTLRKVHAAILSRRRADELATGINTKGEFTAKVIPF